MTLIEKAAKKIKKSPMVTIGNILASLASLFAVTLLIFNIISFKDTLNYCLDMGYPSGSVLMQLIPSQLLPGVFEPIAIYGGIAFLILYVSKINQKVSECMTLSAETEVGNDVSEEENISKSNVLEEESASGSNVID